MIIDFETNAPVRGNLSVSWIHGSPRRTEPIDPPTQEHWYDEHTVILRQSKDVSFEAPFVFLLFGNDRALLLDTGAVADDTLRVSVDGLIDSWLAKHPRHNYELVVAHTHGHGDHVASDPSFAARPNTTTVGRDVDAVRDFFRITDWPAQVVPFDLGGRVLELTGLPGHQAASIVLYDSWTGLLFTGDSVLPARVYVKDMQAFIDSMNRLVEFTESRAVTHVLGCHIEMTSCPGHDFPPGCLYQPGEPPLQMTVGQLRQLRDAAVSVSARKGIHRFDTFIIYNGMGAGTILRLNARALADRARKALQRRRRPAAAR